MNNFENQNRINTLYNLIWECIEEIAGNESSYAEVIGILEVIQAELIQQSKEEGNMN
jgi:hypothetical protein